MKFRINISLTTVFFIPKNCAKVNYYVIKLITYNSIKISCFLEIDGKI